MTDTSPEDNECMARIAAEVLERNRVPGDLEEAILALLNPPKGWPAYNAVRALAAENDRLRAENATAYQRVVEAYNILSAAIKEQEAGNQRFAAIVSERVATGGPLSFAVEDLDGPDWEEAITRAIRALPIPDKEGE